MGRRGRRRRRRPRWPIALLAAALTVSSIIALFGVVALRRSAQRPPVAAPGAASVVTPLRVEWAEEPDTWPRWGLTHTQYTAADDFGDRAVSSLAAARVVQNQHIMGFGAGNPEPRPGEYDFSSLDERVRLIAETGGVPVITLCCAPDWMKGGRPGTTDWSLLEIAPRREHFDDFARLAAAVARRYPQVRHFIVWNEFKGFWDQRRGEWDAVAYTELYNRVYDALKEVDPRIRVGGPYMPVDSYAGEPPVPSEVSGPWGTVDGRVLKAIDYWLRHKRGADFIVVDGGSLTAEGELRPDEFGALGKFGAMTRWLRERSGLPVWWAEFYPLPCASLEGGACPALGWPERRRLAVTAAALIELAESGAATVLHWDGYAPRRVREGCPFCLIPNETGEASATLRLLQRFAQWFPHGTEPVPVALTAPDGRPFPPGRAPVRALAQERRMVLVNTTGTAQTVLADGTPVALGPYEVRWLPRAPDR
ncbi:hypothetical protein Tbis_1927 [Thermobispora bispora DSM 43833]|uniref:Xylan 1,4-beta-xylosidase n=1 Tax=Thermobispora bispora (strain ATCC 19993 / DSM 43833 / CBS 139.67 / JCM 10125 / KCTC 9307 / NBRC 14880 / R51) TaxID=469371 RepID=D6Y1N3_THEBD|nr:hypothetical protein Tbis_1927 [Thermobispora bispora DSM 43833]